jgi:FdhD protein
MEIRVIHCSSASGSPDEEATDSVSVTMRTPGYDFELAAGFLYTEGVLPSIDAVDTIAFCTDADVEQEYNIVNVTLRPSVEFDIERLTRNFYTTSSCGVCGKASLDAIHVRGCPVLPTGGAAISAKLVGMLPDRLREFQVLFDRTGGLHGAGLFDLNGTALVVREDVGRHNAVDKVIGDQLLQGRLPASDRVLVLSGRSSFELLQKALVAGIPIVVAVGAPSSLAVELARDFNITLVGFARPGSFNVYSGAERITE